MRLLIVDDDALIREALQMILETEEDIESIELAANGQDALSKCQKQPPDLILMDIRMPIMDGVIATQRIKSQFPNIKIIILTTFKDSDYLREAVKAGAEGYILKSRPSQSILESIRSVMQGCVVFEKEVSELLSELVQPKKNLVAHTFTDREFEILQLIGNGFSNKEIAERLYISEGSVRNLISLILEKSALRDRTQLAIYYIKNFEQ